MANFDQIKAVRFIRRGDCWMLTSQSHSSWSERIVINLTTSSSLFLSLPLFPSVWLFKDSVKTPPASVICATVLSKRSTDNNEKTLTAFWWRHNYHHLSYMCVCPLTSPGTRPVLPPLFRKTIEMFHLLVNCLSRGNMQTCFLLRTFGNFSS